jgi:hypothetical protein
MQLRSLQSRHGVVRSASKPTPARVLRPVRCRVARVSAEFIKQGDSPAPSKPAPVPAKPETNGAPKDVPAVVPEAQKPAAQQQDALADLQSLRELIDEVGLQGYAEPACAASIAVRASIAFTSKYL